jgi:hypothetical protein
MTARKVDGFRAFLPLVFVFLNISGSCASRVGTDSVEKGPVPEGATVEPRGIRGAPTVSAETGVVPVATSQEPGGIRGATTGSSETDVVPDDFKIVAHYYAGYSDWRSWETTITRDGRVSEEITTGDGRSQQLPSLSRSDVGDLLEKVKAAEFFEIPKKFSYRVTDNPTLVLTVTMNNKSHEVSIYAPRHLANEPGVKRFLKVWSEVLKKVPSPNPDQKPEIDKLFGSPRGETIGLDGGW